MESKFYLPAVTVTNVDEDELLKALRVVKENKTRDSAQDGPKRAAIEILGAGKAIGPPQDHPNLAQEIRLYILLFVASVDEKAGALRRTALHWAVNSGTAQAVEMLLRYKASPTIKDRDGNDAIALAIKNADKLTTDTKKSESERLDDHEVACKNMDTSLLRDFLQKGLDPKAKFKIRTIMSR
ncbi:hypothetical protein BJ875DRAFT_485139 [Amylocarpus encephaloides]|uniref:Ankyrin repeat protein n=1 Tax=Amylocarpus encephaloides TaxID=45428 RepID=A0A9P8C4G0_9HELO|nr:hypothetical protein BJ875DRAFT_485139 [Amylocarpus encephaloides]